jgi:hypothetical protein
MQLGHLEIPSTAAVDLTPLAKIEGLRVERSPSAEESPADEAPSTEDVLAYDQLLSEEELLKALEDLAPPEQDDK